MKIMRHIMLALLSVIGPEQLMAQHKATMQTCEYWFDYGFGSRVSEKMGGETFSRPFDISGLSAGVHSIGIRFGDSDGLWTAPVIKHFVIPALQPEVFADNGITAVEYWTDYDYAARKRVETADGNIALALDITGMQPGVHTFGYSVTDGRGFCTAPVVKHFVIPALPPEVFADNGITAVEYWTDYDYTARKRVETTDGNIVLALDASEMRPGVHSVGYTVTDGRGIRTAPVVKHFVVPTETEPLPAGIVAYEYWFNKGPRVRVDVDSRNPLDIENMTIEVKDVLPNAITAAYRFNAAAETVVQPDDVTFGIQAFDDLGYGSQAAVSESFAFDVPVDPAFVSLTKGDSLDFAAPTAGVMRGFRLAAEAGDSVILCMTAGAHVDMYDGNGQKLECTHTAGPAGRNIYAAEASGTTVYVLVWGAPVSMTGMSVEYTDNTVSGIGNTTYGLGGITVRTGRGALCIETATAGLITVVSASGATVVSDDATAGVRTYALSPGVYIVRHNGRTVCKTVVKP